MPSLLYSYAFWIGLTAVTPAIVFILSGYVVKKVAEEVPQNTVMTIQGISAAVSINIVILIAFLLQRADIKKYRQQTAAAEKQGSAANSKK